MIRIACPHCDMKFQVKEQFAGRTGKCPTCKHPVTVPKTPPKEDPVPVGKLEGTASSLHQAGLNVGVTLDHPSGSNGAAAGNHGATPGSGIGARAGRRSVAELLAGHDRASRYVIEDEIARGGMGAVVRAVDCDIRREVAIKYMLDQSDPGKQARFVEEAQITGQLEHPNIVPIHELGVDAQGRLFCNRSTNCILRVVVPWLNW